MTATRFLDTNVLLHSIFRDPAEARKRAVAINLLNEGDLALSVQLLQEFYVQATRVTRPDPIAHDLVVGLIRAWFRFAVQAIHGGDDRRTSHQTRLSPVLLGRSDHRGCAGYRLPRSLVGRLKRWSRFRRRYKNKSLLVTWRFLFRAALMLIGVLNRTDAPAAQ